MTLELAGKSIVLSQGELVFAGFMLFVLSIALPIMWLVKLYRLERIAKLLHHYRKEARDLTDEMKKAAQLAKDKFAFSLNEDEYKSTPVTLLKGWWVPKTEADSAFDNVVNGMFAPDGILVGAIVTGQTLEMVDCSPEGRPYHSPSLILHLNKLNEFVFVTTPNPVDGESYVYSFSGSEVKTMLTAIDSTVTGTKLQLLPVVTLKVSSVERLTALGREKSTSAGIV